MESEKMNTSDTVIFQMKNIPRSGGKNGN